MNAVYSAPASQHLPAGTTSYTCRVRRGRGSSAKTFASRGADTEAEAIRDTLEQAQAAGARVQAVVVSEWTADGKGFQYSNLMFGGRTYSLAEARKIVGEIPAKPIEYKAEDGRDIPYVCISAETTGVYTLPGF